MTNEQAAKEWADQEAVPSDYGNVKEAFLAGCAHVEGTHIPLSSVTPLVKAMESLRHGIFESTESVNELIDNTLQQFKQKHGV